jgi:hypothetical protein
MCGLKEDRVVVGLLNFAMIVAGLYGGERGIRTPDRAFDPITV